MPAASETIPEGLATILRPLDDHIARGGEDPVDAKRAAELLRVESRTVVGWATSRQLSGQLLARSIGWRFALVDLRTFVTKRYFRARR